MKNSRALFLITVLTLLILSSCFLQKSYYKQGYNLVLDKSKQKVRSFEMVKSDKNSVNKKEIAEETPVVIVSADNKETASETVDLKPKKTKLIIGESHSSYEPVETTVADNRFKNDTQKPNAAKKNDSSNNDRGILMTLLGLLVPGLG